MTIRYYLGTFLFAVVFSYISHAKKTSCFIEQPEELGQVNWYRDYDEAASIAVKEKKDILILFQEVPGCATCRNYGNNVLSHPLMVEAIEELFVPLAIFNNKGGKDKVVLNRFNEPSWNNPVIRIINSKGENIVQRISGDYSPERLCKSMKLALSNKNRNVPEFLNLLELELQSAKSKNVAEKYFKMYCFWSGEKLLGSLDGVLTTESGFSNHSEVVKIKYNPNQIAEEELDDYAKNNHLEPIKNNLNYKVSDKDVHYYLKNSKYKYLPLTELQKTKINSALGSNNPAKIYLSPQQINWFNKIKSTSNKGDVLSDLPFEKAWRIRSNN